MSLRAPALSRAAALCVALLFGAAHPARTESPPNIIYILADDLGYGDVQCLNPDRGRIPTPRMDHLAREGMTFTDAHASSSVCTPTRYSILTGRYNWRTTLQSKVLNGLDPPLIPPDRLTVAGLLQQQGYRTACIGKWHLGLGLATTDGEAITAEGLTNVDWSRPIQGGPVELGFDTFFGISSSLNIPPYIYIEDDPGETVNRFLEHPEIGQRLLNQLESDVRRGRSTAGDDQSNDVDAIVLWKTGT